MTGDGWTLLASTNCLMMRLGSASVNLTSGVVIERTRHSSIHMHLTNSAGAFFSIIHGVGFMSKDHDLVSSTTAVIASAPVLSQIAPVVQGSPLLSEMLQAHHNGNRREHVSLEHQTSGRHAVSFVDESSNCALCRSEGSIGRVIGFDRTSRISRSQRGLGCITSSFKDGI